MRWRTGPRWRRRWRGRASSWPRGRPAYSCCARRLADYNAAEPLGIEGVEAGDDLVERDGTLVLGALAIGGKKMKTHKACVRRLFERSDLVLNADGVYAVAKEIV